MSKYLRNITVICTLLSMLALSMLALFNFYGRLFNNKTLYDLCTVLMLMCMFEICVVMMKMLALVLSCSRKSFFFVIQGDTFKNEESFAAIFMLYNSSNISPIQCFLYCSSANYFTSLSHPNLKTRCGDWKTLPCEI